MGQYTAQPFRVHGTYEPHPLLSSQKVPYKKYTWAINREYSFAQEEKLKQILENATIVWAS